MIRCGLMRIHADGPLLLKRCLAMFAMVLATHILGCAVLGTKKPHPKWLKVTGTVEDLNGKGIIAATVSASMGGSTGATDFSGSFELRVPYHWTGVLTAQHIDYHFAPRQRTYTDTTSPITCAFSGERRAAQPAPRPATSATPHASDTTSPPVVAPDADTETINSAPAEEPECARSIDCDDDQFCTGTPRCDAGVCITTGCPCPVGTTCDEQGDTCLHPLGADWTPPIGIPATSFGIVETAPDPPDPWSSATEGFYFVNSESENATDFLNAYGTPDRPRKSIPRALPAGAVVEIHGRYERGHSGGHKFFMDGTVEQPVFVRGSGSGSNPIITKRWEITGQYVILENLTFADEDGDLTGGEVGRPTILSPSTHVALRYCDVSGNMKTGGVAVASWDGRTLDHTVIYHNFIHDNGDWQANFDQDRHGVAVLKRASHVWIVDNEFTRNSGDGVQINGDKTTHHIYIGRNRAWQNKQTGFWSKTAVDVVISQNVAYDHKPSGSSPGAAMGWQYDADRVWFLFNRMFRNSCGIRGASIAKGGSEAIYIVGNVIHDTSGWGVEVWSKDPNVYIVGNTIYDTRGGITGEHTRAFFMSNNIIANVGGAPHVELTGSLAQRSAIDHCLFYSREGAMRVKWNARRYDTVGAMKGFAGQCADCLEANPLFVNADERDFHLRSDSPAIAGGHASDVYATFEQRYGIAIASDLEGTARRTDPRPTVGAYEPK